MKIADKYYSLFKVEVTKLTKEINSVTLHTTYRRTTLYEKFFFIKNYKTIAKIYSREIGGYNYVVPIRNKSKNQTIQKKQRYYSETHNMWCNEHKFLFIKHYKLSVQNKKSKIIFKKPNKVIKKSRVTYVFWTKEEILNEYMNKWDVPTNEDWRFIDNEIDRNLIALDDIFPRTIY